MILVSTHWMRQKEHLIDFADDGYDQIAVLDEDTGFCYKVITLEEIKEEN